MRFLGALWDSGGWYTAVWDGSGDVMGGIMNVTDWGNKGSASSIISVGIEG